MKLEVAESLFLSWLRHVRGCRIAQLNWKPSKTWDATRQAHVEPLFCSSRQVFQALGIDLFRKTNSVSQLLKQAEIDAIGISEFDDQSRIVAVDVAFHEGGLNYGTKDATTANVLKKILRTLFAVETYFSEYSREIIFATPKINNAQLAPINVAMQALDRFLEDNGIAAECRVIANAEFFTEIVEPVTKLANQVADTGELFMRSVQLLGMAPKATTDKSPRPHGQRIGELVRDQFQRLLEQKILNAVEIDKLCTEEYSKKTFGLLYPTLQRSNDAQNRFDDNGHARYYSKVFADEFLLCNDWYERNRERFVVWLADVENCSQYAGGTEH